MRAFHIDRANSLKENQVISLMHFSDIKPEYLNDVLTREYPEGLSRHGDQYYASQVSNEFMDNMYVEAMFEYERKSKFPHMPSRFQSIFATDTVENAILWIEYFELKEPYAVWEIEFDHNQFSKHDARWLSFSSPLFGTYCAEKYWLGSLMDVPRIELLIKLPVTVIRKVSLY